MGGEVVERTSKEGRKGQRRRKRRIAVRIDMTPMVDIAFLLLIFYMVTTVFAMPQAMEINLPEGNPVLVHECNLLTIRVDAESRYWWNVCDATPDNIPQPIPARVGAPDSDGYVVDSDSLRGLLVSQNRANPRLSTLILIHREGDYADMVHILDEIDLIERSWNAHRAAELGIAASDLTGADRFSYRYALGDWETPRDDNIVKAAMEALRAANQKKGGV